MGYCCVAEVIYEISLLYEAYWVKRGESIERTYIWRERPEYLRTNCFIIEWVFIAMLNQHTTEWEWIFHLRESLQRVFTIIWSLRFIPLNPYSWDRNNDYCLICSHVDYSVSWKQLTSNYSFSTICLVINGYYQYQRIITSFTFFVLSFKNDSIVLISTSEMCDESKIDYFYKMESILWISLFLEWCILTEWKNQHNHFVLNHLAVWFEIMIT